MSTIISTNGNLLIVDGNTSTNYPNINTLNISGSGSTITNPSSGTIDVIITGGAGFVPYTGAIANVNLGTYNLTTPLIYGSTASGGTLTLASTSDSTNKGKILFGTSAYDEVNNRLGIGTTTPTEKLTVSGNIIANLALGGYVKIYDSAAPINIIESNQPTYLISTGTNYLINRAGGDFAVQTNGSAVNKLLISMSNGVNNVQTQFTYNLFVQANVLASTEVSSIVWNGNTKTWNAGAIATQRWFHIKANTAAFVSSSTITNSYGLYIEKTTAGANAIITNNWALGLNGGIFINGVANTVLANASLATTAINGFLYIPTSAGIPTGVPTAFTGTVAMMYDTTGNKLYIYNGAWKSVGLS